MTAHKRRNLFAPEMAIREMGGLASLHDGLDYLDLLAELKPEKLERALPCVGMDGSSSEASAVSLAESQVHRVS